MSSEFRLVILIVAVLALAAWAVKSWAAEAPMHVPAHVTAPPPLQSALVRSAAGASVRAVSGF